MLELNYFYIECRHEAQRIEADFKSFSSECWFITVDKKSREFLFLESLLGDLKTELSKNK